MLHGDILEAIFHINPEPMTLSRFTDSRYVEVNAAFLAVFGYARDEVIGHTARELGIWANMERDRSRVVDQINQDGYIRDWEATFLTKSGEAVHFLLGGAKIEAAGGPYLLLVGNNVTALRRSEAALRESEALYRGFLENLPLGVVIAQDGLVRYANDACLQMISYDAEEVIGRSFLPMVDEADRDMLAELHHRRMTGDDAPACYDLRMIRKDGSAVVWRVHASTVTWEGRPAGLIAFSEVTAQVQAQQRVTELALHDNVTGLPNRLLLSDRTRQAIASARRQQSGFALIYVDLDGFKSINDTLGHNAGDRALKTIAGRLLDCMRDSDTAARVGGDEFVVLLPGVADRETAVALAEKLLHAINRPINIAGGGQWLGASLGIGIFPADGADLDRLMHNADKAMYRAKSAGGNCIRCTDAG
jgi:chemotaxis family two-component system sensor kinase Cph1